MKRFQGHLVLLAIVVGLCGLPVFAEETATGKTAEKVSDPDLELATTAAKKVDRDEAVWRELTDKLQKAVERYNPASSNPLPERQSLEAFRSYCGKLVESGRSLLALHDKWNKASDGLDDSLRKAPVFYRHAAKAMREKSETVKFSQIKTRYLVTAEIWEKLAQKAEERSKDLRLDQRSGKLVEFLREEVEFLETFCKTLDALPGVSDAEGGRSREFMEVLTKHTERSDELERQLRLFRDRLKAGPRDGAASK